MRNTRDFARSHFQRLLRTMHTWNPFFFDSPFPVVRCELNARWPSHEYHALFAFLTRDASLNRAFNNLISRLVLPPKTVRGLDRLGERANRVGAENQLTRRGRSECRALISLNAKSIPPRCKSRAGRDCRSREIGAVYGGKTAEDAERQRKRSTVRRNDRFRRCIVCCWPRALTPSSL
jgi:hypothetical protein